MIVLIITIIIIAKITEIIKLYHPNIMDNAFVMMNTSAGVWFEKLPFRCHHLER